MEGRTAGPAAPCPSFMIASSNHLFPIPAAAASCPLLPPLPQSLQPWASRPAQRGGTHLEAGVELEEEVLARLGVEEVLHRARADVAVVRDSEMDG